ncbi:hypothetical protein [Breoghania sp.]|uniref:hypothetical protein n=1 Tax=Breoghania sp. TaxID=2065378 RepID=UPI0029CA03F1|nr:hypothetical protein [Breoghania sp.]
MREVWMRRQVWFVGFALALLIAVSGCDEVEQTLPPNSGRTNAANDKTDDWLELNASETPSRFLARRAQADPNAVVALFPAVAAGFRESPRMVANRVLQIWRIAQEEGDALRLEALLENFASLPPKRPRISLGTVTQLYRVQRDNGDGHAAALAAALEEAH